MFQCSSQPSTSSSQALSSPRYQVHTRPATQSTTERDPPVGSLGPSTSSHQTADSHVTMAARDLMWLLKSIMEVGIDWKALCATPSTTTLQLPTRPSSRHRGGEGEGGATTSVHKNKLPSAEPHISASSASSSSRSSGTGSSSGISTSHSSLGALLDAKIVAAFYEKGARDATSVAATVRSSEGGGGGKSSSPIYSHSHSHSDSHITHTRLQTELLCALVSLNARWSDFSPELRQVILQAALEALHHGEEAAAISVSDLTSSSGSSASSSSSSSNDGRASGKAVELVSTFAWALGAFLATEPLPPLSLSVMGSKQPLSESVATAATPPLSSSPALNVSVLSKEDEVVEGIPDKIDEIGLTADGYVTQAQNIIARLSVLVLSGQPASDIVRTGTPTLGVGTLSAPSFVRVLLGLSGGGWCWKQKLTPLDISTRRIQLRKVYTRLCLPA